MDQKQFKLLRRILTATLLVLVLATAAFTVYVIVNKPTDNPDAAGDISTTANLGKGLALDAAPDAAADPDSVNTKAAAALANSGLQAFLDEYQDSISYASTDVDKSALYLDRALDLFSYYSQTEDNDFLNQALNDALEAERLNPTAATASALANIYEYTNDSAAITKYRSLARERAPDAFKDLME